MKFHKKVNQYNFKLHKSIFAEEGSLEHIRKRRQKEHRFSRIFLRYFVLLFLCLVLPIIVTNTWYNNQSKDNLYEEIIKRNEASLEQAYKNIDSVISSAKNLSYSLSADSSVQFLAYRPSVKHDTTGNLDNLLNMISMLRTSSDYIDSIYVYFDTAQEIVSNEGAIVQEAFADKEILKQFSKDMPRKIQLHARAKKEHYPYLLSILCPIRQRNDSAVGMAVVNIDVEKLGDFLGSGRYNSKTYLPKLLIFDNQMETLMFSDEYRLLREQQELEEFKSKVSSKESSFSEIMNLWETNYVVSGIEDSNDAMKCFYLSTTLEFDERNQTLSGSFIVITAVMTIICLILAFLLAKWVYRPIRSTVRALEEMSMLTEWDRKAHMDEIEAIQRSILLAKKDYLNEQIQERIISLHNAQICALQTQINPHFMYNTLAAIGNSAALLLGKENVVSRMIFTLAKLLRTSLSGENYLVPLSEELEHVDLYVQLVTFRYHGRIQLYQEIPEELFQERIVKLTLQPLIENAIQHGLAQKRREGYIWLRGEKKEKDIYLYVIDNGTGVSEERITEIREQLLHSSIMKNRHIGMGNVDQRLKLIFGEEYGLDVGQAPEGGLCVTVHIREM